MTCRSPWNLRSLFCCVKFLNPVFWSRQRAFFAFYVLRAVVKGHSSETRCFLSTWWMGYSAPKTRSPTHRTLGRRQTSCTRLRVYVSVMGSWHWASFRTKYWCGERDMFILWKRRKTRICHSLSSVARPHPGGIDSLHEFGRSAQASKEQLLTCRESSSAEVRPSNFRGTKFGADQFLPIWICLPEILLITGHRYLLLLSEK